ncbi:MAG: cell division protein FtsL [Lachnospiraceae bacterium]|nr:cell division protein FtsL [Lachnospiraceae bacterium]
MANRAVKTERRGYVTDGNTARKALSESRESNRLRVVHARRVRAEKHRHNVAYLFFLTVSLAAGAVVLAYYIMLQTQITNSAQRISSLERQLSDLTKENDETYNQINGNIDLEEIRRIAISEYGMRYVEEGQIVTYSDGGGSDYVRQKAEIPESDARGR